MSLRLLEAYYVDNHGAIIPANMLQNEYSSVHSKGDKDKNDAALRPDDGQKAGGPCLTVI